MSSFNNLQTQSITRKQNEDLTALVLSFCHMKKPVAYFCPLVFFLQERMRNPTKVSTEIYLSRKKKQDLIACVCFLFLLISKKKSKVPTFLATSLQTKPSKQLESILVAAKNYLNTGDLSELQEKVEQRYKHGLQYLKERCDKPSASNARNFTLYRDSFNLAFIEVDRQSNEQVLRVVAL